MDKTDNYQRIADAIDFLRARHPVRPELRELATHLGLSPSHTQRLFSRWVGISPKRFQQYLSVEYAKQCMARTGDMLHLSLASGMSGPGRLHDLFVNMEAMSPGEFKAVASGIEIRHGIGVSPFGLAHIAYTARGICHLVFVDDDAGNPLSSASAHPFRLSIVDLKAFLDHDGCNLRAETFRLPNVKVSRKREIVRISRIATANCSCQSRQATIEAIDA